MAITLSWEENDQLDRKQARAVGIAAVILAPVHVLLQCLMVLDNLLVTSDDPVKTLFFTVPRASLWAFAVFDFIASAVMIAAGIQLARGKVWAQRLLLGICLVFTVIAGALTAVCLMNAPGKGLSALETFKQAVRAGGPFGIIIALLAYWTAKASLPRSRLRYSSLVIFSVVVVITLTFVVNAIAQTDYVHKDLETLGRYGISERTKRILKGLDDKVRLTCVYTVGEEDKETLAQRDQVMELLEEIRQSSDKVEVFNAVKDSDKGKVLERLGLKQGGKAEAHQKLLADFKEICTKLEDAMAKEKDRWTNTRADPNSYISLWPTPGEIVAALAEGADALQETRTKLDAEMKRSGVLDYTTLVDAATETLKALKKGLQEQVTDLEGISKVPQAVQANRKSALEALDKCLEPAQSLLKVIGGPRDPDPADPPATLKNIAAAAKETGKQIREAAEKLDGLAGKDGLATLQKSRNWLVRVQRGALVGFTDMGNLFRELLAEEFDGDEQSVAAQAEAYLKMANAKTQTELIRSFRQAAPRLIEKQLLTYVKEAKDRVERFAAADPAGQELLKQAGEGKCLEPILKPINELLDRAEKLPKLENTGLSGKMSEKNILILEAGGKTDVVGFSEVWPLKVADREVRGSAEKSNKRIFNGDSVISSKLLLMTHSKPFATVLLTYFEPQIDPQMAQMMRLPRAPIPVQELTELRRRLEEANFQVKEWNLTGDMPADEEPNQPATTGPASMPTTKKAEQRPKVLVVLPPPPMINMPPYFGRAPEPFSRDHLDKIRRAIDSGIPAIFLAMGPQGRANLTEKMAMDLYLGYLRDDWGIQVLDDYRLIAGDPDKTVPNRFRLDVVAFSHMPLAAFEDHPIGKPLRGQRMLWYDVCPIRWTNTPGVRVWPLLNVPSGMTNVWATNQQLDDLYMMVRTQRGGYIDPNFSEGRDMRPPMTVALAAARDKNEQRQVEPARLVVLGVGGSMIDGFVTSPVPELEERAISFGDPPLSDLDLVVNGVYWLSGAESYIAAGPAQIKPVAPLSATTLSLLWTLCVVVLPLLVLGAGGVVLFLRRR